MIPQQQNVAPPQQQAQAAPYFGYPPKYESDAVAQYGSIIRDLTDSDHVIDKFWLKLRGKQRDPNGGVVNDPDGKRMCADDVANHLKTLLESVSNLNTHYTNFDKKDADNVLRGLNYELCRYLMLTGEKCPLRYRGQICFEVLAIAKPSVSKCVNMATMRFAKGTFTENWQQNPQDNVPQRSGALGIFNWFGRKR